jgi:hypothetical protein
MKMLQATETRYPNQFEYANATDFCRIFTQDINSLYLLSLLLSGDHEKAEQCFLGALENATSRRTVFKEWARSWARRSVIQSAQLMLSPRAGHGDQTPSSLPVEDDRKTAHERIEIAAVLALEPFDRFVFVMSVLEGYSSHECAILLGTTLREVTAARSRAFTHLGHNAESLLRHQDYAVSPVLANEKPTVDFRVVARSA